MWGILRYIGWTFDKPKGLLVLLPSGVESLGGNLVKSCNCSKWTLLCVCVVVESTAGQCGGGETQLDEVGSSSQPRPRHCAWTFCTTCVDWPQPIAQTFYMACVNVACQIVHQRTLKPAFTAQCTLGPDCVRCFIQILQLLARTTQLGVLM